MHYLFQAARSQASYMGKIHMSKHGVEKECRIRCGCAGDCWMACYRKAGRADIMNVSGAFHRKIGVSSLGNDWVHV
jgi:hypothetical protein